MHSALSLFIALGLASSVAADASGTGRLGKTTLDKRQVITTVCAAAPADTPPELLCAASCGPGNIDCTANYCLNPSAGETCCSDCHYCPAGQHCVVHTDGSPGCCPDEGDCPDFLSTVSTVPGGFSTATSALSSTSSIVSASTSSSLISAPIVSTSSASTSSSFVSAYPTAYGSGTNYTSSTTPSIAVQTTNAGNRLSAAEDLVFALGGVAMLLRWL
ncbi:hypothetical protein B0A48_15613 [Cryoendolithus antarcticus]|uniref:Uncharacterized protein n=1 Tax=Cryoendolithus antarcticus TaxID=1507870 RepID=A0A1V8SGT3_9PEZI|nr:hypothetical protein B0A48_15613 [Cryoendolithus antarcticus]